ncbi:MAG: S8 family serine peptidase [Phycisphaerales bacterium]
MNHARVSVSLSLVLACGCAASLGANVTWKNADLLGAAHAQAPGEALARLAARAETPRVIVRFDATPDSAQRVELARAGLTLLTPLGDGAYFARPAHGLNARAIDAIVPLAEVSPIALEHKLDARLMQPEPPAWSVTSIADKRLPEVGLDNPVVGVYVIFHADADSLGQGATDLVTSLGGTVMDTMTTINGLIVELPYKNVRALASDDRVQWVETPLPRLDELNDSNRAITQANIAQSAPYNLDGTGVTVLVYDGGTARATHQDFGGRVTVVDASGTNYHSTHVAGTVGGSGAVVSTYRGMAPGVDMIAAGFEYDGTDIFLYTNPGDIETDYTTGMGMGAVIATNSIGSNTAPNGFPCGNEGDYGATAAVIDSIIRGNLGDPIVIFWAAGNERGNGCGDNYYTSGPPANNKNAITVGALNSNDDSVTSFTSWGPSDDGRLRPVIAGPGCQSNGDGGVTSTDDASDTAYYTLCGTSMACPTLAGLGALIFEDYRLNYIGQPDPSNQLIKAWMCHTAADIVTAGPDYQTGYGSARVVDAINQERSGSWSQAAVDHHESALYSVYVAPGTNTLKITMAWDDPAATPNVTKALINDLDLVVVDPAGNRHYPWTLDPRHPEAGAVQTKEDHLNNIEQVQVAGPMSGTWRVEVNGYDVPSGPQSFAITSTPALGAGVIGLSIESAAPDAVLPGTPVAVEALVTEDGDTLSPGSVTLYYRQGAGSYSSVPMAAQGAGIYAANIPSAFCGDPIEYYVSATGNATGTITDNPGDDGAHTIAVGQRTDYYVNNLQSSSGWAVTGVTSASAGGWQQGVPAGDGDRGDPETDADGSGACYLTGNAAGNTDVDGGTTTLTSPNLDATVAADPWISYARWFNNQFGANPGTNTFTVEISNNGGSSWTTLETVGPSGKDTHGLWQTAAFRVSDYVTPTNQVRLRFNAADNTGAVVEAAVDDIRIYDFTCTSTACSVADIDANGTLNLDDVNLFANAFITGDLAADMDNNGTLNLDDVNLFAAAFIAGCP